MKYKTYKILGKSYREVTKKDDIAKCPKCGRALLPLPLGTYHCGWCDKNFEPVREE